jgi:hypothetical protein
LIDFAAIFGGSIRVVVRIAFGVFVPRDSHLAWTGILLTGRFSAGLGFAPTIVAVRKRPTIAGSPLLFIGARFRFVRHTRGLRGRRLRRSVRAAAGFP